MTSDSFDSWSKFLDPEQLKQNLIQCSLFLAGYEMLRSSVVDRLQSFYTHEMRRDPVTDKLVSILDAEYQSKVISLHPKDEFHAGCIWFRNAGALNDDDIIIINAIRGHRNYVAHEIGKIIGDARHTVNRGMVDNLVDITRKIDLWWLKEIEIPTNPDFDHRNYDDIDWEATIGGTSLMQGLIMSIFDGDDRYLRELHKTFSDAWKKKKDG